jgi:hypothetical protein
MAIPRHKRSNNSADNRPSKRPRPIQRGRAGGHLDHSKDSTPRRTRDSQRPSMPTPNQESHLESPPIDDDSDEFASFHHDHDGSDLDEDIEEDIEEHDRYHEDSDTTNPDIENTRERRLLEKHARSTNESHSRLQIETQVSPYPLCLNFCTKSSGSLALLVATKPDEATQHPQAQAQSSRQSILILYRSLVAPV